MSKDKLTQGQAATNGHDTGRNMAEAFMAAQAPINSVSEVQIEETAPNTDTIVAEAAEAGAHGFSPCQIVTAIAGATAALAVGAMLTLDLS